MEDTICAISTSLGVGAISIVRISGPDTLKIISEIFSSDIKNVQSHTIKYGHIVDNGEVIDEVLLMIMKAPKTYTKEDIVEINCHGGINTTNKILEVLLRHGCRLAEPGEFTKRAYLNGRINLLEAEAVGELIKAKSDSKRKLSLNQLGGNLTKKINNIRDTLLGLMANIEVNIDYPEYTDNLVITEDLLRKRLGEISHDLKDLVNGAKFGKIVNNGINVAIVGKPNVGKSSILNHLLDEKKAIVTDIAGTTRDIIEGTMSLNGIEVNLIDTAGIHETDDLVESLGVQKSLESIQNADVVLLVIDGSKKIDAEDKDILRKVPKDKTIIFVNKSDKLISQDIGMDLPLVYGNTMDLNGLEGLKNKLIEFFDINRINKDLTYLSSARQIDLVNKANEALEEALNNLDRKIPIDMIENNLKSCFDYLGQIIGDTYDEAVIDRLFQDFCVGK